MLFLATTAQAFLPAPVIPSKPMGKVLPDGWNLSLSVRVMVMHIRTSYRDQMIREAVRYLSKGSHSHLLHVRACELPGCVLSRGAVHGIRGRAVAMNAVVDAVNAYVDIWSPTIESFGAPELLIKWFHGLNMGIVLTTMASFGAYLGWKIKGGDGESFQLTGKTAKKLHPTLMGLAFLLFYLGGQGGLVFMSVLE